MSFDFSGKVVVVSGATGNLGSEVVRQFHDAGAKIALLDLNQEKLDAFIEKLDNNDDDYVGFAADLSKKETVDEAVDKIVSHFGRIDVLAHTVGGYAAGDPVHDASIDVFDKMMGMNARPIFLLGGTVARHMVANDIQGKLVFVLAKAAQKGSKGHGAYIASKAAATRIMESMAAELREKGIGVNGVSPSTIDTPPNRNAMPNADYDKWVTPAQIANGILFLASDNSGLYGTNLEVFGKGG